MRGKIGLEEPSSLPRSDPPGHAGRQRRARPGWALFSLLGGMFMGNVDIAVVNVAVPSIHDHLHASGGALNLIVSGYTLAYATLLITGARMGDVRGRRRTYICGLAVFTAFSLACGIAPDPGVLVAARLLQGAGAAMMVPQVLTGIQTHFEGVALKRALGAYIAVLGAASVIGQALGGILITANILGTGWRPVFLINVPVGIFLLITSYLSLAGNEISRQKKQDYRGVALLSAGLFLVVVPLVLGQGQGWPPWTWACLAASVPALALFVRWEQVFPRRGGNPLVNVALLARRQVSLALLAQGINRACYFALLLVLALYLQQGLGKSAAYSGTLLIAYMVTFGLAGPALGKAGTRVKTIAPVIGALAIAASFAGIAVGAQSTGWLIVLLSVGGFGNGAAWSGILERMTDAAGPRYAADVSGLFNTTLQVGGTMGTAVFGTVYVALAAAGTPQGAFGQTNAALAVLSVVSSVLLILATIGGSSVTKRAGGPAGLSVLPAPGAPLLEVRALGAEGGVLAVAGVDPGLIGQPVEQLGLDSRQQRGEPGRVLLRVADTAGEQAVAGEQVRAVAGPQQQGDAAGGVADQMDGL